MNRSDGLEAYVRPVHLEASPTSYFSTPEKELDPELFVNTTLRGWVRNDYPIFKVFPSIYCKFEIHFLQIKGSCFLILQLVDRLP